MCERRFGPVRFLPVPNRGKYPHCHSVYVEGAGLLIDPGADRERLRRLRSEDGVAEVWLTHWHEDHIMYLDLFDDLPVFVGEPDALPLSGLETFLDAYGMDIEEDRAHWRSILTKDFHFKPRNPKGFLRDGDILHLDGVTVDVIGTPGHTPGHLSFFFREPRVLFIGDYDLFKFGPWYGDMESSIEQTITSVNRLRSYPAKVWLTGHETGVFEQDPGETWDQYLNVISMREDKLFAFLEQPRTLEEIVGAWIVYGKPREPKALFEFGERALMKKHLKRLLDQGRIFAAENGYYSRRDQRG
jgi:glyoxylase-like metal-dependent hydrolase (beta-lactamase superfamily II)